MFAMEVTTGAMSNEMTSALSDAMSAVKLDVMDGITTALPIALGIAGVVIAIRYAWKIFKSMTKA